MLDKRKILKVEIYCLSKGLVVSSDNFNFLEDFITPSNDDILVIKGSNIDLLDKGTLVEIVFYFVNGDRVKYDTRVELSTDFQINISLGDRCTLLEERRRFYKLETDLLATIAFVTREGKDEIFEQPLPCKIKNINIGGVFLTCDFKFELEDIVMIKFFVLGRELNIASRVLRKQRNDKNEVEGYGCCFLNLKNSQEENLARYIHNVQLEEKDRIKDIINSR